jgi:hypothetical protein
MGLVPVAAVRAYSVIAAFFHGESEVEYARQKDQQAVLMVILKG